MKYYPTNIPVDELFSIESVSRELKARRKKSILFSIYVSLATTCFFVFLTKSFNSGSVIFSILLFFVLVNFSQSIKLKNSPEELKNLNERILERFGTEVSESCLQHILTFVKTGVRSQLDIANVIVSEDIDGQKISVILKFSYIDGRETLTLLISPEVKKKRKF
jgi:multisubunit Na+/H+ antiporter MnhE subunit